MTDQTGNNKPNDAEGLAFPLSGNEKLIEEARRAKRAVYLATDASVANDLSRIIGGLADALEATEKALTPADDEREALRAEVEKVQRAAWAEVHGQDPTRKYSVAEVKQLVYSFDNVLSTLICGPGVPQEHAERHWAEYRDAAAENNTPDQYRAFFAALRAAGVGGAR